MGLNVLSAMTTFLNQKEFSNANVVEIVFLIVNQSLIAVLVGHHFFEPINSHNIIEKTDRSLFMKRTEILCSKCDAHLGHVFPDGPAPSGLRYCMNGIAMVFQDND